MTRQDEIEKVHGNGVHVVILGAGASYASTLRNPEKSGKRLPLMKNIVAIVGLERLVDDLPPDLNDLKENFEQLYSAISNRKEFESQKKEIETAVYNYFSQLSLPDEPTIYDYLVLSLRSQKDVIATFNWDPFLYQAYVRNGEFVKSPGIVFLHGCVSLGYDKTDESSGPAEWYSKYTRQKFEPTPLLYPVDKKDYNTNPYIKGQWDALSLDIKDAERVTVFGYSAPVTDVEAIDLLQAAWGTVDEREMEQFELIDIRSEEEVVNSWKTFIHSHHYSYHTNYFQSSLAYHPRRTVESYHHWSMPMTPSDAFQDGNAVPQNFKTLDEMWRWHNSLIEAEDRFYNS